jgi:hypothetical protein
MAYQYILTSKESKFYNEDNFKEDYKFKLIIFLNSVFLYSKLYSLENLLLKIGYNFIISLIL